MDKVSDELTSEIENMSSEEILKACKCYLSRKMHMKTYIERNKDTVKERNRRYLEELKKDPERYHHFLQKKHEYYISKTKPKLESLKQHQ